MWTVTRWFDWSWWAYLFSRMECDYDDVWYWRLRVIYCRTRGHLERETWCNPVDLEPRYTCRYCGENLE